ncbi:DNA binding protein [Spodoptera exempta nucleopolyhedrovirus]|uniref:DNA binding protein n=1 Tax=Spodoptera exempta nucleopolyhedrovirus TaxID=1242863 RepID=A0A410S7W4_9ABAC|nr:DNA binding protein [Spodoptera exempta nucleopolyhedrovirus]QAT90412.1 DNA binding protein [Spodoptera exempta nucleopolyhedrovirus]
MASKRSCPTQQQEISNKRLHIEEVKEEQADNQLSVYNSNNDDDNDADDEVHHPDDNKMLCIFKTPTFTRQLTWIDTLCYNLDSKNLTVLRCETAFNKLFESLNFLRESVSLDQCMKTDFTPEISDRIVIVQPVSPRVVYTVGKLVKGGAMPFYFFDFVKVRRCTGKFGQFFSITWSKQYIHNEAFGKLIIKYNNWDDDTMKLQNVAYVNFPGNSLSKKTAFVRKFFDIKYEQNQRNYMTGRLAKAVVCEPFTVERFDDLFKFETPTPQQNDAAQSSSSDEIEMLAGIVVDGFKQSKEDVKLETVTSKKLQEKTYSLSIKPMVFFKIEEI